RTLKDAREIEAVAPKLDLAEADTRGVHQIVDQLRELADLTADHVHAPLPFVLEPWRPRDERRVADGGQRVAQLVREHGEELVLAAVGVEQLLFGLLARRDVFDGADVTVRFAKPGEDRTGLHVEPAL